jgi:hypothetical protein
MQSDEILSGEARFGYTQLIFLQRERGFAGLCGEGEEGCKSHQSVRLGSQRTLARHHTHVQLNGAAHHAHHIGHLLRQIVRG